MSKFIYIFLIFFGVTPSLISQKEKQFIDSLKNFLQPDKKDSVLANNYILISNYYLDKNAKESHLYAQKALNVSNKLNFNLGIAKSEFLLAQIELKIGKPKYAINHYLRAKKHFKVNKKEYYRGECYLKIGNIQVESGDFLSGIKNIQIAISIFKKLKSNIGLANCNSDLGYIFYGQNNFSKSIQYYKSALDILEKENQEEKLAELYNRVSIVFKAVHETEKSLNYNFKALLIHEKLRCKSGMAQSNLNIAETNLMIKEYSKAKGYLKYSTELYEEIENQLGISRCLFVAAKIALVEKSQKQATKYLIKCIEISEKCDLKPQLIKAYKKISHLYVDLHKFDSAFYYLAKYDSLKATVFSIEKSRQISEIEAKYHNQVIQNKLKEITFQKEEESERAFRLILFFFLGTGIFVIVILILKKNNKKSKKNNANLERKNQLIEKKNNEILDSILYAKKIQDAILTSKSYIDGIFTDHFILYNPKDILSGDFYWAYNHEESKTLYWATIDCTGHGVPGALMSMIGTVLLNEAVIIKQENEPNKILTQINKYLKKYINKTDSLYQTQDGMEMSFCKLNKESLILETAGAIHSVYVIRNKKIIELKGDKIILGKDPLERHIDEFSVKSHLLRQNDLIYTFTDGFSDQIGGPDRKKFKIGSLKSLLIENSHLRMEEQKDYLQMTLSQWKDGKPQLDDVLIMGVKI